MGNTARKLILGKDHGHMEEPPDLLEATMQMNLNAVKECLRANPSSIHMLDDEKNNAMHLCIGGGSFRVKDIIEFLATKTAINLLHVNSDGYTPIDLAIAINDREAADFLYEPTVRQLHAAHPDPKPELKCL